MTERPVSFMLRDVAPEALVGGVLFLLIVALTAGDAIVTAAASASAPVFSHASTGALADKQLILVAGVLSMLVAFDLAVFRHVYRFYAGSQPGVQGRTPALRPLGPS